MQFFPKGYDMNNTVAIVEVQSVFERVIALPSADRQKWLEEHYGLRQELVAEVQSLLQFSSLSDDPLEQGCHIASTIVRDIENRSTLAETPVVEGYSNLARLAEGGQGFVYQATQLSTGQQVAIKILKSRTLGTASQQRLLREARLLAELQHPNIVPIIDQTVTHDGNPCLVMRLVHGKPMDEFFGALAGDKWQVFATVMSRICGAVEAAHCKGVVHRDLKPSNILVDDNNEPCLLDFGLSSSSVVDGEHGASVATREGDFVGSVAWASPEQVDSSLGSICPQTDVYQLAVIAYQLLSGGQFPYSVNEGAWKTFQRIVHDPPAPLSNAELEESQRHRLDEVLSKALRKVPQERFGSAVEFGEALAAALIPSESHGSPQSIRSRGTLWKLLCLAGLSALLMAAFVGLSLQGNESPDEDHDVPQVPIASLDRSETAATILSIDFHDERAPHLPKGWTGAPPIRVENGQLTVPAGTRVPAVACTEALSVEEDWILTLDHEVHGNGRIDLSLVSESEQSVELAIHHGRIESVQGQRGTTPVTRRRRLVVEKDGDRFIATLQGGKPVHLDATQFSTLSRIEFAFRNSGSGGGAAGIHRIVLQRKPAAE